jgi:hypothetical protein
MKKATLFTILGVLASVPFMTSAATITSFETNGWETTYVSVVFEKESDRVVVELNGLELFSVKPEWIILGEAPYIEMNKSFSFDINTNVPQHDVKIFLVSNDGTKTLVK